MKLYEKAKLLCDEFSNDVIFDKTRYSIVINIDVKYLRIIKKEMEKLNYNLVFAKNFNTLNTITLCFTFNKHGISS